jgi:hypothetical protein
VLPCALLIVALVAAVLPVGTSAQTPLRLDWTAVDRLRDRDGDGVVDGSRDPVTAASPDTTIRVRVSGAGECEGDLAWLVDGKSARATRERRCTFVLEVSPGEHDILLDADGRQAEPLHVEVRDRLVVSIGDSVASGEGNPDLGGLIEPTWLERRCHRSMRSGTAQAAVAIDRGNPQASVTFVPLACSGATVQTGLFSEYDGVEPDPDLGPLPAQVPEIEALAGHRPIDALLLSIGANDIHFSSLTIFCAAVDDCSNKGFDPDRPFRETKGAPAAAVVVREALAELRVDYARLGDKLREFVLDDRVIAVQYFDPLRDAGGEPCLAALPGIDSAEAEWAQTHVLGELNGELRRAADENRWRYVTGVADVFRDHGICAEGPAAWVRRLPESFFRQANLSGTLHPNGRGHLATAALISPVLATALGEDLGTGQAHLAGEPEGEGFGDVAWWWLPIAAVAGVLLWLGVRRLGSIGATAWTAVQAVWLFARQHVATVATVAAVAGLIALGVLWSWIPLLVAVGVTLAYLGGRWLSRAALAYLAVAVVGAGLTFAFEPPAARLILAVASLLGVGAYATARWRAQIPATSSTRRRLVRFGVFFVLGAAAFISAFVDGAVILGLAIQDRTEPIDPTWLEVGVWGLAFALVWVIAATWRSFWGEVRGRAPNLDVRFPMGDRRPGFTLPSWVVSGLVGVTAVLALIGALSSRPRSSEVDATARAATQRAIEGPYKLLLVIDPGDPLGKRLINVARHDRAQGRNGRLFAPYTEGKYHVAFGLAVPLPPGGRRLWRLVEPPTQDHRELGESLAQIPREQDSPAAGSYGRLLADVLSDPKVRWGQNAERGVAFLLQRAPSLAKLDEHVAQERRRQTVPAGTEPARTCQTLVNARPSRTVPTSLVVPIAWQEALGHACPGADQPTPMTVQMVTGGSGDAEAARWATWTRALGGYFATTSMAPSTRRSAVVALRTAVHAHTGQPVGGLTETTHRFRPFLRFDSGDPLRPMDVDWLLANPPQDGEHQVCARRPGRDPCDQLDDANDLAGSLHDYISIAEGPRRGSDYALRLGAVARMYVHARVRLDRLYLGYWWFLPYNSSPWRSELNCLPGFSFADLSCFDHEGDWEGVTVVLEIRDQNALPDPYGEENLELDSVIFDSHGRSIRWGRDQVEVTEGSRPVVYVAAGSHAAYPAGCRAVRCEQGLSNESLGEGRFDGKGEWKYNDVRVCKEHACLIALPSTRAGRKGTLWNAFEGRWGSATCSSVAKACYQTEGPASPSMQSRFTAPWLSKPGDANALLEFWDAYNRR